MSISGRKSTIDEIITKYKYDKSRGKTIYIEGVTDRSLIQWFLKQSKLNDIEVLKIESVEVPKENVLSLELEDNNRNRIITLTTMIDKNIIGLIDSDFDFIKDSSYPKLEHLCITDYANMEMYCFNEKTIEKILLSYPSKQYQNYKIFLEMLSAILENLFLISFAKKELKNELSKIDFIDRKYLSIDKNTLSFNQEEYLQNYLSKNIEMIKKFDSLIATKKELPIDDKRKVINGHDFIALLQFYLAIKQRDAKTTFEKSIYTSLEYNDLKEEEMFKKLLLLCKGRIINE